MNRSWLLASFLSLAGCSQNVGPTGLVIGGPCFDDFDCASGSFCLRAGFPGGTCTTNCRTQADCRGGSTCVEHESGVCLLSCESDEDCGREGYVCRERERRGEVGRASVCVGG
ncbi:MAG TPA: hypothetical protein VIL20_19025 [Sandaracinaceae bacterium]